jgi:hypothetical protein
MWTLIQHVHSEPCAEAAQQRPQQGTKISEEEIAVLCIYMCVLRDTGKHRSKRCSIVNVSVCVFVRA